MSNFMKRTIAMCLCMAFVVLAFRPLAAEANTEQGDGSFWEIWESLYGTGTPTPSPTEIPITEVPAVTEEPLLTEAPAVTEEPAVTEAAEITATMVPDPTQPPVPAMFPADRLTYEQVQEFETSNAMTGTLAGLLLTDLTTGTVLAAKNSAMITASGELNEWMLLLYAFRNADTEKEITITKAMLDDAKKAEYPVLFGFAEGDKVTMETLLLIFMMTRADDARTAIAYTLARNETNTVSKMNQVATKLKLTDTNYTATDGAYAPEQHTTVYDLYVIIRELLTYELFDENYAAASKKVSYTAAGGKKKTVNCTNSEHLYSNLYGEPLVPEGFTFLTRMSGGGEAAGLTQAVLAEGPEGHVYLGVIAGIPFEKDVAIESERLLRTVLGEVYTDKEQELPTGDDVVRYDYLFGSDVEYFTVDNKAPGYASAAEADRYMMSITVPVWHMNADGSRYSSTMTMKINRKLYTSVKAIFQEIYELPVQFPIRTLLGYGYRQSGGVGLSNCTLMSVHSYGAAIDINPADEDNDYYLGAGNDLRDRSNPYCIPDEVIEIFEKHGWFWGGYFNICVDSMHFQYLGLDYLSYQDNPPFETYDLQGVAEVGYKVENLQERLNELGYRVNMNGIYTAQTRNAVMKFQTREGLEVTGTVDYKTWETLINLTHYMPYAF